MKRVLIAMSVFVLFLGYRVLKAEDQIAQLQQNTAIAILSAEAANNKVGAIAPYLTPDKEAFTTAWMDNFNLPLAVFPDDVLVPIKQRLERLRGTPENVALRKQIFQ
jgi:hypothetical protein